MCDSPPIACDKGLAKELYKRGGSNAPKARRFSRRVGGEAVKKAAPLLYRVGVALCKTRSLYRTRLCLPALLFWTPALLSDNKQVSPRAFSRGRGNGYAGRDGFPQNRRVVRPPCKRLRPCASLGHAPFAVRVAGVVHNPVFFPVRRFNKGVMPRR
jgi:hypothetical protein